MGINITLRDIQKSWNPAIVKNDSRLFLLRILPDCYSKEICSNNAYAFNKVEEEDSGDKRDKSIMSKTSVDALFRGNRLTLKDTKQATPGFTEHFILGLKLNPLLDFIDKTSHPDNDPDSHFRGNMFGKILSAVNELGSPTSKEHALFSGCDFSNVWENTSPDTAGEFLKVGDAVASLLEHPTSIRISYAIFLIIVTAIVQDRIAEVSFLYDKTNLEKVDEYQLKEEFIDTPTQKFGPFFDPFYFDYTYHTYIFREESGKLWDNCTFRMERKSNGRPVATLIFNDTISSPITGSGTIKRTYVGTPMYSSEDKTVFIGMTDEKNTFLMLSFPYCQFRFAAMYFRTGYVLNTSPTRGVPKVQKIAITAKPVEPAHVPYMEGLLKMDSEQLFLSQLQLDDFLTKFKSYPWMKDFKKYYLPIFKVHRTKSDLYQLNSSEILECSMGNLDRNDRTRVLLALKSMDASNNPELHKYAICEDPKQTHKIFKYDASSDAEAENTQDKN